MTAAATNFAVAGESRNDIADASLSPDVKGL